MIIDAVKSYFETCPLLSGKHLNVTCLDEKVHSCVIIPERDRAVIAKYPDGGSLRQFVFTFSTRESFDSNVIDNLKVAKFYEDFAAWVESKNLSAVFPVLPQTFTPVCFEILSSGYLFDASGRTAKYQIKLRLLYEKN